MNLTVPEHLHNETKGFATVSVLSKHSRHCPYTTLASEIYTMLVLSNLYVYYRWDTKLVLVVAIVFDLADTICLKTTLILPIFKISP